MPFFLEGDIVLFGGELNKDPRLKKAKQRVLDRTNPPNKFFKFGEINADPY
jgi:hypothetical protein